MGSVRHNNDITLQELKLRAWKIKVVVGISQITRAREEPYSLGFRDTDFGNYSYLSLNLFSIFHLADYE